MNRQVSAIEFLPDAERARAELPPEMRAALDEHLAEFARFDGCWERLRGTPGPDPAAPACSPAWWIGLFHTDELRCRSVRLRRRRDRPCVEVVQIVPRSEAPLTPPLPRHGAAMHDSGWKLIVGSHPPGLYLEWVHTDPQVQRDWCSGMYIRLDGSMESDLAEVDAAQALGINVIDARHVVVSFPWGYAWRVRRRVRRVAVAGMAGALILAVWAILARHSGASVPLSILAAFVAAVLAVLGVMRARWRAVLRRAEEADGLLCLECLHDLRDESADPFIRCPTCGTTMTPTSIREWWAALRTRSLF